MASSGHLRARFLLALGLPGMLGACGSSGSSTNTEPPVTPPPVRATRALPPPRSTEAGGSLVCGADEARELACTRSKEAECAPALTITLGAAPSRVPYDYSDAPLTHDPALSAEVSAVEGDARCCYVRCYPLEVAAHATLASPGFRPRCVPMPDEPSSVPAAGAPSCPAAIVPPGGRKLIPFDKQEADPSVSDQYPPSWTRELCCYLDDEDWPTGVGRPLVVAGARRLPEDEPLQLCRLAPELRPVAEHWHAQARGEHASVEAFSQLALDLRALDAPAPLIDAAHRAAADEVAHARLSYRHLSRLVGRRVTAGPLEVRWTPKLIEELAEETLCHGCYEETLGARLAEHLAGVATDEALRRMLRRIAAEELEHAELAFRILAFCVRREPSVLPRLDAAYARLSQTAHRPRGEWSRDLEPHGVPSAATVQRLARSTCRDLVGPCLAALATATRSHSLSAMT